MLLIYLLALAASCAACAADAERELPSNELLRHYRSLSDPQLAPDGTRALLRVSDATADGGKSHLWLIEVNGGKPRQLTFSPEADKRGELSGRWLPDGQGILFLAHRGEHTSLFELPMNGGEARALDIKVRPSVDASRAADALPVRKAGEEPKAADALAPDIDAFEVSPDGAWIAFLARDPETPGEKQQKEAKADAEWVDRDPHGTRLYLLRRETAALTSVELPIDVRRVAWKGDSSGLIALVEGAHNLDDLGPAASAWQVDLVHPDHPARIAAIAATVQGAAWSLDGKSILYTAQAHQDAPPGYSDLYVLDTLTSGTRNLTAGLEGSLAEGPVSLPEGGVAQLIEHGVDVSVAVYAPTGAAKLLQLPISVIENLRTNARRSGWLMLGSSGGHPPGLYYASDLMGEVKQLETPSVAPAPGGSVTPKRIRWSHEGLSLDGLLYLPSGAAGHAVPLVVEVHGGPMGAYRDVFVPFVDFLVGHGWAVLRTNPRGSSGRGAAFAAANKNDLGGGDYRDIMSGVDYVLRTEPVDPKRLALMGYSYGGEMAAFVEGRTSRFKAIVSGAPVIDQYSEYGTEGSSWYDRWYFGKPWERASDAWRQSPLSTVRFARTPMLLLQGQADTTDPLGQSQEMYRALRQAGVPVELVSYPREDHGGLSRALYGAPSPEAWHGFDARRRVIAFIEKAFGGAQAAPTDERGQLP
jgi:dipeptidyl aminopeptidase/acylaminoacyl peptidase